MVNGHLSPASSQGTVRWWDASKQCRPQTFRPLLKASRYAWLAARKSGDVLDLIGPLGTGFDLPDRTGNLLLVSNSQQLSPLLGQLELAVDLGCAVTLALESSRAASLYPVSSLPPIVEFRAATRDGSLGYRGTVIDLLPELLSWADLVCVLGSPTLYRDLKRQAEMTRLSLETGYMYGLIANASLACGVGACFGCMLETRRGLKLACADGPVFDLAELDLAGGP